MLLRRVGGSGDMTLRLNHELLLVQAGRARKATGGGCAWREAPKRGGPCREPEGRRPARRGAAAPLIL